MKAQPWGICALALAVMGCAGDSVRAGDSDERPVPTHTGARPAADRAHAPPAVDGDTAARAEPIGERALAPAERGPPPALDQDAYADANAVEPRGERPDRPFTARPAAIDDDHAPER